MNFQTLWILELITYVIFIGAVIVSDIVYRAVETDRENKKKD